MKHKKQKRKGMGAVIIGAFMVLLMFGICLSGNDLSDTGNTGTEAASGQENDTSATENELITEDATISTERLNAELEIIYADIPEYTGIPYIEINDNHPYFEDADLTTDSFEYYSELDELGRCGVAYANVCQELMPQEKRGEIGQIKPSGWQTVKYPNQIVDNYLYNRCHLIAYQLAGENTNEKNLITGTQYMNISGMEPFENIVADYVKNTNNHVLYRVTPIFEKENLVASGVLMEAESIEDQGEGVHFCVYCYNVQPGIEIDYATGDSWVMDDIQTAVTTSQTTNSIEQEEVTTYIENNFESTEVLVLTSETSADIYVWIPTNGGTKYHSNPNCSNMNNPEQVTLDNAIGRGFTACKKCY